MKKLFVFILSVFLFAGATTTAFADGSCQPIYGGGQTCTNGNLTLQKLVRNPQSNNFVHDLGINDPKYNPSDLATFELVVTNTGNATITHTTLKDMFPQFVSFESGDGSFDVTTKTDVIQIDNLNPGQSKTFTINARITNANNLPSDQGVVCVINQAVATTSEGQSVQDSAQLCIQKPGATLGAVTKTPATGPESLALLAMIPTALAGLGLRKFAKGGSK